MRRDGFIEEKDAAGLWLRQQRAKQKANTPQGQFATLIGAKRLLWNDKPDWSSTTKWPNVRVRRQSMVADVRVDFLFRSAKVAVWVSKNVDPLSERVEKVRQKGYEVLILAPDEIRSDRNGVLKRVKAAIGV